MPSFHGEFADVKVHDGYALVMQRTSFRMIPLRTDQHRRQKYDMGKRGTSFFDANFRNRHQVHCSLAPRFVRVIPPPIPLSQSSVRLPSIVVYHHVAALNRAFAECFFLLDELFSPHNSPYRRDLLPAASKHSTYPLFPTYPEYHHDSCKPTKTFCLAGPVVVPGSAKTREMRE